MPADSRGNDAGFSTSRSSSATWDALTHAPRARGRARLERSATPPRVERGRGRNRSVLLPGSRWAFAGDLAFPPDKGDPKWHGPAAPVPRARPYRDRRRRHRASSLLPRRWGSGRGGGENYGVEQEQLNNVFGVRLRITTLRAANRYRRRAARVSSAARRASGPTRSPGERRRALADHDDRHSASSVCCGRRGSSSWCLPTSRRSMRLAPASLAAWPVRDPDGHGVRLCLVTSGLRPPSKL